MRICVCADSFDDGCAFYRSVGPLSALAKKYQDIQVNYVTNPSWADVRVADILFLQRPSNKELLKAVNAAKQFETKVVVDMDDNLFAVPRDNPAYEVYQGRLGHIQFYLKSADLVITSTGSLKEQLSTLNKNIHVVQNALDPCLYQYRNANETKKMVMWRGTSTHNRDVASISKELVAVAGKYPEFKFMFMGSDPCGWDVSEKIKNQTVVTTPMTPVALFSTICFLKPRILIAPLQDIPFNRAKSNIAALEATLAGAAVLAPAWPEWSFSGVTTYENPSDFGEKLDWLMRTDSVPGKNAAESWRHVNENFTLPKMNELRKELLTNLVYPKG